MQGRAHTAPPYAAAVTALLPMCLLPNCIEMLLLLMLIKYIFKREVWHSGCPVSRTDDVTNRAYTHSLTRLSAPCRRAATRGRPRPRHETPPASAPPAPAHWRPGGAAGSRALPLPPSPPGGAGGPIYPIVLLAGGAGRSGGVSLRRQGAASAETEQRPHPGPAGGAAALPWPRADMWRRGGR